jgi:capsular exopolysaccharide synthesis family protein
LEPTTQNLQQSAQVEEEEPIDLRAYLDVLLKRKWVVALTFVGAVAAVGVFTLRQQKIYSATASLVIDSNMPQILGEGVREAVEVGAGTYWYSKEFYETQYKVIKSRGIAQRAVEQLGLDRDLSFLGIDKLPKEKQERALERIDAVAILQGRIFIEPVKDSRIVNIRVEDPDPERAATLANTVASAYMQANVERRVDGTKDAAGWLQDQLLDLKTKLSESEIALYDFKKENDLIYTTFENKQTISSQKLLAINETLTKVRTRKAELDARVNGIKAAKQKGDLDKLMELGVVASNSFINQLKLSYLETADVVAELSERYGPEHPRMKAAAEKSRTAKQNMIAGIDDILGANLAEYDELVATEHNLQDLLEEVKAESFENNKKEIDYKRLAREEENNQRLYDLVLKRMKELDLSSLLKTNNVRILDAAKVVRIPTRPRVRTNLCLAAFLGFIAGVGLAFLIEYQDRTIKGHQDIEGLGLNFLGLIPSIPGGDPTQPQIRDLFIESQPKSTVAECCRTIRTNLLFMSPDRPIKRLLVTSAGPQEGKTTSLINLGITLANGGSRVLLVDSDMRRPRLHKSFGVSNEVGLSSLIVGEGRVEDAIKSTSLPGLFVMPSGPIPPNPSELLQTKRFCELSALLGEKFDRVLFDSPPVGAVTDPLVLAHQMEGTLLVVKMFRTNKDLAERAVKSLHDAGTRILGAVLNDVDVEKRQYGYNVGYYYAYGQYYGDSKEHA